MPIRYRPRWSSAFTLGLAGVGALPLFEAPFPILALGTAWGTTLYGVSLVALGAAYFIADAKESARDAEEQEARDAASEARHRESMAKADEQQNRLLQVQTSVMELSGLYKLKETLGGGARASAQPAISNWVVPDVTLNVDSRVMHHPWLESYLVRPEDRESPTF